MSKLGISTPVGGLVLEEAEGKLTRIYPGKTEETSAAPVLVEAKTQIAEYFAGERREFQLPLAPQGTEFQRKVWQALLEIPYGETTHYGALAEQIGRPKGARAVGMALNRNPIPIIIPCHRVVGKDGSLTGFAWGLEAKITMLNLEQKVK